MKHEDESWDPSTHIKAGGNGSVPVSPAIRKQKWDPWSWLASQHECLCTIGITCMPGVQTSKEVIRAPGPGVTDGF